MLAAILVYRGDRPVAEIVIAEIVQWPPPLPPPRRRRWPPADMAQPRRAKPHPFLTLTDCAPAASPDASVTAHRRCCWSLLVVVWQGVDVH
jgi:hypothetical protein